MRGKRFSSSSCSSSRASRRRVLERSVNEARHDQTLEREDSEGDPVGQICDRYTHYERDHSSPSDARFDACDQRLRRPAPRPEQVVMSQNHPGVRGDDHADREQEGEEGVRVAKQADQRGDAQSRMGLNRDLLGVG